VITLVTGGTRSGKSRYALSVAETYPRRTFLATAEPFDDELRRRIEAHQRERGSQFATVEEPRDLCGALRGLRAGTDVAVVDCLTIWLGNLVASAPAGRDLDDPQAFPEITAFMELLAAGAGYELVLVTNEVGSGIVPESPLGRAFRDLAGRVNQQAAAAAQRVVLMVCGLPLHLKGGAHPRLSREA
jgi:adenosylcobinamide kinase / adenosylcobinamide-phosphate guanylyltransferase